MNVEGEPNRRVRRALQKEAVARGVSIPENPTSLPTTSHASAGIAKQHAYIPIAERRVIFAEGDLEVIIVVVLNNGDRKSTRLNSSHLVISYAVFCLKKKNNTISR